MQPSSVLALAALGCLLYNMLRQAWRQQRQLSGRFSPVELQLSHHNHNVAGRPAVLQVLGAAAGTSIACMQVEAAAQQHAAQLVVQAAGLAAPVLGAVYAMFRRRLLGEC